MTFGAASHAGPLHVIAARVIVAMIMFATVLTGSARAWPDTSTIQDSLLIGTAHDGFECVDCHPDIEDLPRTGRLTDVVCADCHETEHVAYRAHGRGTVGVTEDIPGCRDCHGTHQIYPASDPRSTTHATRLATTCGHCHENTDLVKQHDSLHKRPAEVYASSVHGAASPDGNGLAATCLDCHASGGDAHRILGSGDPESRINHFRIPETCGECHAEIEREYWEGIHGIHTARGETDAPVCTHCHGEHGILSTDDPRSQVSPTQVAEATCAPCHESAFLNEKYGIPAGRLASYIDSYHGLKSRAGDTEVANCASCHGRHRILPSTDPASMIHPDNLAATCGACHPGITDVLARTPIHATSLGRRTGWPHFVAVAYTIVISVIIGLMVVYWLIDIGKHMRGVLRLPQVRRMSGGAVLQHGLLTLSFTLLVVTGFALRYPDFFLFHLLFAWDGGFVVRGIVHRAAAVLMVGACTWHVLYLRTQPGKQFLRDMRFRRQDAKQFGEMILYNLDKRLAQPRFSRFSYVQKVEYWSVVWGSVIMTGTGVCLWFDNFATRFFSKGFLDVMLVIHFYEAILATLAIALWHMYATVFNPTVYPGNPAWLTGRVPKSWHAREHPEDESGG